MKLLGKHTYRCIKKFPMLSKFLTVIRDLFFCSRYVTDDSRTLPEWGVDRMSTGCRLGVDWVSTGCWLGVDRVYTSQSPVFTSYNCTKNDRLSVSSTENSAIESHPQTVSQNSSFSEMTTENTDRVSVNACQDTDTLVQPCLARSSPYS